VIAARYLCLAIPAALVLVGGLVERDRRGRAAALLAFIAAAVGIAALHEVSRLAGWYAFAPVDGAFRGMPVDLWLGWAALWGAVPVLCRRFVPLTVAIGLLLWLDVTAMPALEAVPAPAAGGRLGGGMVRLAPDWLLGEVLGLLVVAVPAQLLGRWTADNQRLAARMLLQVAVFAAATLWLVPTVAFEFGDGSWAHLTSLPAPYLVVLAQVGLVLAAPALLAVGEFATRGGGTPYPWDPPQRLVVTGPYAYLANPMQLSAVLLVAVLAGATRSLTLGATAVATAAFAAGLAAAHERHAMLIRYGTQWREYRSHVRNWWPCWTPYLPGPPAVLWLDDECDTCRGVGRFLQGRHARHLTVAPARRHPTTLWRARYAGGDGHQERGVAAVARALEHIDLGWATIGWILRLPGLVWLAQLVVDAMIAAPHAAGGVACGESRGEQCPATPRSACWPAPSRRSARTASPVSPPAPSPRPRV
jgi:protein-S-isoprenylcysteine O-methyltransferase Ste14